MDNLSPLEVKFAFEGDFNELYVSKKGFYYAIVDGRWHSCTGSPWFEPDCPVKREIVIVEEFGTEV